MKPFTQTKINEMLERINQRRRILETAVDSICKGFTPALFLWGPPGLGKSHTLATLLDALAPAGWVHHTAFATPKALVLSLFENQTAIHVFEDCEKMLKTEQSSSILRSACGAPDNRDRLVSWETANDKLRFKFRGAVCIVTNQNLSKLSGPMQGVASRFRPIQWNLTLEERIAVIMDLGSRSATKGGVPLTSKECTKVAKRLIEMVNESSVQFDLDIRLFTEHALPAFAQAKGNPGSNWEDLMLAKLMGSAQTVEENQQERSGRLQRLALSIDHETKGTKAKVERWKTTTGLGQSIFYRHLREAKGKRMR